MKFPKKVFVRIVQDGNTEYLSISEEIAGDMAEGERHDVATYELTGIAEVEWEKAVQVRPSRRKS